MLEWINEKLGVRLKADNAKAALMCWYALHRHLVESRLCPFSQYVLKHGVHTRVFNGTRTDN